MLLFDDPENIIFTIPTHTTTGESFMRRSDTHTAPVGAAV